MNSSGLSVTVLLLSFAKPSDITAFEEKENRHHQDLRRPVKFLPPKRFSCTASGVLEIIDNHGRTVDVT
ncbi:MAG: hypothetical protein ACUVQG_11850 [Thermogutta sp.]